jgi:hypothetical protein
MAKPILTDTQAVLPVQLIDTNTTFNPPEKGLALCLSGGGYRAMLFHLEALRYHSRQRRRRTPERRS